MLLLLLLLLLLSVLLRRRHGHRRSGGRSGGESAARVHILGNVSLKIEMSLKGIALCLQQLFQLHHLSSSLSGTCLLRSQAAT